MTTKNNKQTFSLENTDLGNRLESRSYKIKLEAEREAMLSRRANHNHTNFLRYSKFTHKIESVFVARGQFFTTYQKLAKIWNCSKDQVRYQLKKWKAKGVIKVENKKDQRGFDLGLIITYNWLFNQQKENRQKNKSKIPTRERTQKAHQIKDKNFLSSKIPTHNKEVLSKDNIHKKDDVFFEKSEKEKNQIKEIKKEFAEIKINPKLGNKFLELYSLNLILDYLRLLKINGDRVTNKAGWLVNALKQNYDLQKVETWKEQEEEFKKRQEKEEKAEIEAIKLQEEREKKQQEEERLIENWKAEKGEEKEKNLYFEALEDFKQFNSIIYKCLMRKKPQDQDLLDYLKTDIFVKSKVRTWILQEAREAMQILA
jgi:hypothetical protein